MESSLPHTAIRRYSEPSRRREPRKSGRDETWIEPRLDAVLERHAPICRLVLAASRIIPQRLPASAAEEAPQPLLVIDRRRADVDAGYVAGERRPGGLEDVGFRSLHVRVDEIDE